MLLISKQSRQIGDSRRIGLQQHAWPGFWESEDEGVKAEVEVEVEYDARQPDISGKSTTVATRVPALRQPASLAIARRRSFADGRDASEMDDPEYQSIQS